MSRREPIEDHYGTQIEVNCAFKSGGPTVYLERQGGFVEEFDRFTPGQARDLAKRLTDAADEIEGRS